MDPDPPAEVVEPEAAVVVDDELVELQAAPTRATTRTSPSAVDRLFHEAERKAPPMLSDGRAPPPPNGTGRREYVTLRQKLRRVSNAGRVSG